MRELRLVALILVLISPRSTASDSKGGSYTSGLILGIAGGVIGVVLLVGLFLICKTRRKHHLPEVVVDVPGEDVRRITFGQIKRFAWEELQIATYNFNERNVLGKGSFGKVYKGVLPDSTIIAVKRLTSYQSSAGEAAFFHEVEIISVALHRNLLNHY
ncbi:hypothetical protein ACP70R_015503 [Stipagrostis hirtigluma subsp. patula]